MAEPTKYVQRVRNQVEITLKAVFDLGTMVTTEYTALGGEEFIAKAITGDSDISQEEFIAGIAAAAKLSTIASIDLSALSKLRP